MTSPEGNEQETDWTLWTAGMGLQVEAYAGACINQF